MSHVIEEVVRLAKLGIYTIPTIGKGAFEKERRLTLNEDELRYKYHNTSYNFGIPGGVNNLIIFDFDGPEGMATLEEWRLKGFPGAWESRSGNGGAHLFLQYPKNIDWHISSSKWPGNVQLRVDLMYVVGATSIHPTTKKPYRWVVAPTTRSPIPGRVPTWLMDMLYANNYGKPKDNISKASNVEFNEDRPLPTLTKSLENTMYKWDYPTQSERDLGIALDGLKLNMSDDDISICMLASRKYHHDGGLGPAKEKFSWNQYQSYCERTLNNAKNRYNQEKVINITTHNSKEAKQKDSFSSTTLILPQIKQDVKKHPIPYEILEPILGSTVDQICEYTSSPPEFIVGHLLAALCSAPGLGLKGEIRKEWTVYSNIFHILLAPTGENKSSGFNLIQRPLKEAHEDLFNAYVEENKIYKQKKAMYDRALKNNEVVLIAPEKPVKKEILFDNFTVEGLINRAQYYPHCGLIASDEFNGVIQRFGQYKNGAGGDINFLIEAFDNNHYTSARVKDEVPVYLKKRFFGAAGNMQPHLFEQYKVLTTASEGWWDRFLITSVRNSTVTKLKRLTKAIDLTQYNFLMRNLLAFREAPLPNPLYFEGDAFDMFSEWDFTNQQIYKSPLFHEYLKGFWAKCPKIILKIALMLQACENINKGGFANDVNVANVHRAITIVEYFQQHRKELFNTLSLSETEEKINEAVKWIQNRGGKVTPREFLRGRRCGCSTNSEVNELFSLICDAEKGMIVQEKTTNNRDVTYLKLI